MKQTNTKPAYVQQVHPKKQDHNTRIGCTEREKVEEELKAGVRGHTGSGAVTQQPSPVSGEVSGLQRLT